MDLPNDDSDNSIRDQINVTLVKNQLEAALDSFCDDDELGEDDRCSDYNFDRANTEPEFGVDLAIAINSISDNKLMNCDKDIDIRGNGEEFISQQSEGRIADIMNVVKDAVTNTAQSPDISLEHNEEKEKELSNKDVSNNESVIEESDLKLSSDVIKHEEFNIKGELEDLDEFSNHNTEDVGKEELPETKEIVNNDAPKEAENKTASVEPEDFISTQTLVQYEEVLPSKYLEDDNPATGNDVEDTDNVIVEKDVVTNKTQSPDISLEHNEEKEKELSNKDVSYNESVIEESDLKLSSDVIKHEEFNIKGELEDLDEFSNHNTKDVGKEELPETKEIVNNDAPKEAENKTASVEPEDFISTQTLVQYEKALPSKYLEDDNPATGNDVEDTDNVIVEKDVVTNKTQSPDISLEHNEEKEKELSNKDVSNNESVIEESDLKLSSDVIKHEEFNIKGELEDLDEFSNHNTEDVGKEELPETKEIVNNDAPKEAENKTASVEPEDFISTQTLVQYEEVLPSKYLEDDNPATGNDVEDTDNVIVEKDVVTNKTQSPDISLEHNEEKEKELSNKDVSYNESVIEESDLNFPITENDTEDTNAFQEVKGLETADNKEIQLKEKEEELLQSEDNRNDKENVDVEEFSWQTKTVSYEESTPLEDLRLQKETRRSSSENILERKSKESNTQRSINQKCTPSISNNSKPFISSKLFGIASIPALIPIRISEFGTDLEHNDPEQLENVACQSRNINTEMQQTDSPKMEAEQKEYNSDTQKLSQKQRTLEKSKSTTNIDSSKPRRSIRKRGRSLMSEIETKDSQKELMAEDNANACVKDKLSALDVEVGKSEEVEKKLVGEAAEVQKEEEIEISQENILQENEESTCDKTESENGKPKDDKETDDELPNEISAFPQSQRENSPEMLNEPLDTSKESQKDDYLIISDPLKMETTETEGEKDARIESDIDKTEQYNEASLTDKFEDELTEKNDQEEPKESENFTIQENPERPKRTSQILDDNRDSLMEEKTLDNYMSVTMANVPMEVIESEHGSTQPEIEVDNKEKEVDQEQEIIISTEGDVEKEYNEDDTESKGLLGVEDKTAIEVEILGDDKGTESENKSSVTITDSAEKQNETEMYLEDQIEDHNLDKTEAIVKRESLEINKDSNEIEGKKVDDKDVLNEKASTEENSSKTAEIEQSHETEVATIQKETNKTDSINEVDNESLQDSAKETNKEDEITEKDIAEIPNLDIKEEMKTDESLDTSDGKLSKNNLEEVTVNTDAESSKNVQANLNEEVKIDGIIEQQLSNNVANVEDTKEISEISEDEASKMDFDLSKNESLNDVDLSKNESLNDVDLSKNESLNDVVEVSSCKEENNISQTEYKAEIKEEEQIKAEIESQGNTDYVRNSTESEEKNDRVKIDEIEIIKGTEETFENKLNREDEHIPQTDSILEDSNDMSLNVAAKKEDFQVENILNREEVDMSDSLQNDSKIEVYKEEANEIKENQVKDPKSNMEISETNKEDTPKLQDGVEGQKKPISQRPPRKKSSVTVKEGTKHLPATVRRESSVQSLTQKKNKLSSHESTPDKHMKPKITRHQSEQMLHKDRKKSLTRRTSEVSENKVQRSSSKTSSIKSETNQIVKEVKEPETSATDVSFARNDGNEISIQDQENVDDTPNVEENVEKLVEAEKQENELQSTDEEVATVCEDATNGQKTENDEMIQEKEVDSEKENLHNHSSFSEVMTTKDLKIKESLTNSPKPSSIKPSSEFKRRISLNKEMGSSSQSTPIKSRSMSMSSPAKVVRRLSSLRDLSSVRKIDSPDSRNIEESISELKEVDKILEEVNDEKNPKVSDVIQDNEENVSEDLKEKTCDNEEERTEEKVDEKVEDENFKEDIEDIIIEESPKETEEDIEQQNDEKAEIEEDDIKENDIEKAEEPKPWLMESWLNEVEMEDKADEEIEVEEKKHQDSESLLSVKTQNTEQMKFELKKKLINSRYEPEPILQYLNKEDCQKTEPVKSVSSKSPEKCVEKVRENSKKKNLYRIRPENEVENIKKKKSKTPRSKSEEVRVSPKESSDSPNANDKSKEDRKNNKLRSSEEIEFQRLKSNLEMLKEQIDKKKQNPKDHIPYIYNDLEPYADLQFYEVFRSQPQAGSTWCQFASPLVPTNRVSLTAPTTANGHKGGIRRGVGGCGRSAKTRPHTSTADDVTLQKNGPPQSSKSRTAFGSKRVEQDYTRTRTELVKMSLDKLNRTITARGQANIRSALFAYLQNTPGSRKALYEIVRDSDLKSARIH